MEKKFLSDQPTAPHLLTEQIRDLFQAFDAIPIGVAAGDRQGRMVFVNRRILESLGYERDEVMGRSLELAFGGAQDRDELADILKHSLEDGWKGEITANRKDGSLVPIFMETIPLRNRHREVEGFVAIARDISDQRAFQQRLVAEEKLGTLGLIAHNVTHEVRNHLSAIRMSLYMLEKAWESGEPSPDNQLHFSIAREELNRIELFLRTLVNYARPPKPRFSPSDLVEVVSKGLEDARPTLILKSVALFRQFPRLSPIVSVDPTQFAQAVTQVVENASQAMERQGEVHVVIKRQPVDDRTWWLVEIRDNGPGIAPHLQERVFEPFFSTTSQHLGLGLSNVERILELHGGEVLLASTPGRGTVVTLRIPEEQENTGGAQEDEGTA